MRRWCRPSLHASIVRKTTKYTALCSNSKKHASKNWLHVPLSPHNFCDRSPQRPTSNSRTHGSWSYLARPLRAVYHTWMMTLHRLYGISSSTPQSIEPRQKKNLLATWHWCQLDRDWTVMISIRVKCWWHRVFSHQRTVVDVDHRAGWTQIFGSKASKPKTSGPVVNGNFYLPHLDFAQRWSDFI